MYLLSVYKPNIFSKNLIKNSTPNIDVDMGEFATITPLSRTWMITTQKGCLEMAQNDMAGRPRTETEVRYQEPP